MLGKIEGRGRRGLERIRWLDGITNSVDMSLSKPQGIGRGRKAWHDVVHEVSKIQTWLSDWTITTESIPEAELLTITWEVAEGLDVDHSTVIRHLKHTGKKEKLDKLVPYEQTKNQKNCHFEVLSSLILHNNTPFLDLIVKCDEKWILYDNRWQPAQWLNSEEAAKHLPKPNLHQKKIMVTAQQSAASLIHYSFLNPGETITSEMYAQQINEMHLKLQCLKPALVNRRGLILLHGNAWPHAVQTRLQNRMNCATVSPQPYLCVPLPTNHHFLKHLDKLLQGKRFHNQQEAENTFQEFVNS